MSAEKRREEPGASVTAREVPIPSFGDTCEFCGKNLDKEELQEK